MHGSPCYRFQDRCERSPSTVQQEDTMTKFRVSALVIVAVTVMLTSNIEFDTSVSPDAGVPALIDAASPWTGEFTAPDMGGDECGGSIGDSEDRSANPCKGCPKGVLPGCIRLSCEPCCFKCPGEPAQICL